MALVAGIVVDSKMQSKPISVVVNKHGCRREILTKTDFVVAVDLYIEAKPGLLVVEQTAFVGLADIDFEVVVDIAVVEHVEPAVVVDMAVAEHFEPAVAVDALVDIAVVALAVAVVLADLAASAAEAVAVVELLVV